jgi:hypothetical protein
MSISKPSFSAPRAGAESGKMGNIPSHNNSNNSTLYVSMDPKNRDYSSDKSCWVCASNNHLARKCPNRLKGANGASAKLVGDSSQVVSRGPPPTRMHSVQVEGHTAATALKTNLYKVSLVGSNQVIEL